MNPWKILVVDDEPIVLDVLRAYLEHMGHDVITCEDSREALPTHQREAGRFDMLITDYRMPCVNGLQLAEMLRLFAPAIPILMVTGFREEACDATLHNNSMTCITKPMRYHDLYHQLQKIQRSY